MIVTDYNEQFLDKRGTDHLIDELKAYIDSIATGNVDLSDYVTKSELQAKLDALHINIDLSSYATKEELTQAINNIDLSSYALKTEIPSLNGYATTEYVDNAVANVPSGGNVDLSNYYTKEETYSKTEVDTAISNIEGGGNTSSDSCALYDTVVANGGAVKEIIETEKPVGTNLSEIISDVANGKEVVGDGNGNFYVRMNPDKTQEELNAEFVLPNDENGRLDFLLASSFQPEEIIIKNSEDGLKLRNRLKNGERMYYIIASKKESNDNNYIFYYGEVFYNKSSSDSEDLSDTCYNNLYKIYQGNVKFNVLKYMQNMKYICSGAYYNGGLNTLSRNDKYYPQDWLRFKEYLPTGTEYTYTTTVGNNTYSHTISENISSPEFSAHLLDTYLSNCNETLKISETVNYTLAEWGNKLDNSQGIDGISPTISIAEKDNGHTVSITDVNGTKSFDVTNGTNGTDGTNGTNGTDGVSPTVTITKEGKVATITCTDVNGTTTATISDGADGQGGGSGGGGASGITYAYDTEIATGDTWIDGKPIYMKVFHIDALPTKPKEISMKQYYEQNIFADQIVSVNTIWKQTNSNGDTYYDGNSVISPSNVATSSSYVGGNVNDFIIGRETWVKISNFNQQSTPTFSIWVGRGAGHYNYACDVIMKYTKI